jgi:hypothetical protein
MIQYLKQQYEQEKEQILLEVNKKLNEYKNKPQSNSEHLASLENSLKDLVLQK